MQEGPWIGIVLHKVLHALETYAGVRWFIPGERLRPFIGLSFELNLYNALIYDLNASRIGLNISTGTDIKIYNNLALDIELSQTFNHINFEYTDFDIWPDYIGPGDMAGIQNGRFDEHLFNPAWLRIFLSYQL